MTKTEFDILLNELTAVPKECEWVEFKVNNSNPQDIGEYISALSNSACYHKKDHAYLIFGIENNTHKRIGTSFRPLTAKIKNQEIENWLVTQLNPKIDVNIYEHDLYGLHFAVFKIQATRNTPVSFKGEYFIRIGSYKKNLNDHPEREREIWKIENNPVFENDIARSNLSSNEVLELINYPAFFELLRLPLPENKNGILSRMIQEKIIVKDNSHYNIRNIGALLFAKNLNQFDSISRKAIRVIFYQGKNRVHTIKEQLGGKGYAVGFRGLMSFLESNLPSNEVINSALREEVSMYPILALRELVANAMIHQDFHISGSSPMIEIFENRIEITNPGKPIIDALRFIDHNPQSRNEILARFMRRMNICEERGSGIDKVIFECEYNQLPAPDIIVGDNYTRVVLYAHKTLKQMDRQDKIRACYQHACLRYVSGEYMTNQSLRNRFGIEERNYATASRIIAATIEKGLVKDYDSDNRSKKYAKYVPFWY